MENILVIKLGALGDILYASTAFRSLRGYYPNSFLTLLTTPPYEEFCQKLGLFDQIVLDDKPKIYQIKKYWNKRQFFSNFQKIYDLQMVDRTKIYRYLTCDKTKWVNYDGPNPDHIHPLDRFNHQFNNLGIPYTMDMDLSHLAEPLEIELSDNFALLVPGASMAHQGKKCWGEENFAKLANNLLDMQIYPIIIGGQKGEFCEIKNICPQAIDLCGLTSIYQLIYLSKKAKLAIGNDTGPIIAIHSGGCPTLTLYSGVTKTHHGGVKGKNCYFLQEDDLKNLNVTKVFDMVKSILLEL